MDRDVVIAACAGDADAFAALIDEFTPTVYAVAFGLSGDEHLAADITQEAFTTAYLKLDTLRDPAALPGWLVAVTRSAARVARPCRPVASVRDFVASVDDVDDDVVRADEARRVRRAVEALPTVERLPMALHYFAGRPLAEVAELCDVPLSTVKKRMRTARARIRRGEPKMTTNEATLIGAERSGPSDSVRMFSAMRTGDPTVVGTLLDSRPDAVDVREDWTLDEGRRYGLPWTSDGGTPLLRAVERGDLRIAELLLERGADADAPCGCEGGEYPLWVAASQRDLRMVDLLVGHGADPNRSAFSGLTPLDVATVRGFTDVADRLRSVGARPSAHRPFDHTAAPAGATGIRAIDLWCPLPEQGLAHLASGYGLGAIVVLGELSRRAVIAGHRVVWTGFVPSPLDLGDLQHAVAESGIGEELTMAMAHPNAATEQQLTSLDAGITAAKLGGLLVVFNETGHLHSIDERIADLAARPGTTIVVAPLIDSIEPPKPGAGPYRASIVFDQARAERKRYPAISPNSWSTAAPPRMAELAHRARHAMTDELDAYLAQNFHVAEHLSGQPGETTTLDQLHAEVTKRLDPQQTTHSPPPAAAR